jgi:hypothetical protein
MTPSDSPNSTPEPTEQVVTDDNLDDAVGAFEREAKRAEIEAALEQDRERTFLSDRVR